MKTLEERLGRRFGRLRRAIGLTQAQFAEIIDVQPETICRIEKGKRAPSLALMARIADAFELELHELVDLRGGDTPKGLAVENLLWYVSRVSPGEVELLMDVVVAVLGHCRRVVPAAGKGTLAGVSLPPAHKVRPRPKRHEKG
jgi:DNA-binding XRE family transcriptional regulator